MSLPVSTDSLFIILPPSSFVNTFSYLFLPLLLLYCLFPVFLFLFIIFDNYIPINMATIEIPIGTTIATARQIHMIFFVLSSNLILLFPFSQLFKKIRQQFPTFLFHNPAGNLDIMIKQPCLKQIYLALCATCL